MDRAPADDPPPGGSIIRRERIYLSWVLTKWLNFLGAHSGTHSAEVWSMSARSLLARSFVAASFILSATAAVGCSSAAEDGSESGAAAVTQARPPSS